MPRTLVLALVLAASTPLFGQIPTRPPHVWGTVIDSSTRQPIPNARIQLIGGGSALTSASGTYDILVAQPGSYDLKVEAQGYVPERQSYSVVLSAQEDSASADLQMYRPGVIAGRLIDAETNQPIVGVSVTARRAAYKLGQLSREPEGPSVLARGPGNELVLSRVFSRATDKQGVFRIEAVRPGAYSLSIPPEIYARLLNSDTPPGRAPVRGYRGQYWPNSGSAGTVELRAGSVLELGDILLAREPLYRITGVLTGCPRSDDISRAFSMHDSSGVAGGGALMACGERFSAENLSPGEYLFDLNFEGVGLIRIGQVTIVNRDVEYSPVLSLPLKITGSMIMPENFPAAQLTVGTFPSRAPAVKVDADGKFEMTQGIGEPVEVLVGSLPPPNYVAEILYNGAPLRDGILEVNPYSVVRELKIRIAADGASVNGTARKDDKPAPNSSMVLVAWPERMKNGFPVHYAASAPYGQFTLSGVPPGSYRAIAVEREAWETELQKPGVLSGLASAGTQVDLAPNASKELTLEVRWIQLSP